MPCGGTDKAMSGGRCKMNEYNAPPSGTVSVPDIDRRRDFTKRLNLRRKVYRDLTAFRVFPLQAMAMDDLDSRLADYLNAGRVGGHRIGTNDDNTTNDADDSDEELELKVERMKQVNVVTTVRNEGGSDSDWEKLRELYQREFLEEKSLPVFVVAATDRVNGAAKGVGAKQGKSGDDLDGPNGDLPEKTVVDSGNGGGSPSDNRENANDGESKREPSQPKVPTAEERSPQQTKDYAQYATSQHKAQFGSTLWSMEPRIFAMETTIKGKRRYISSHLGRFMDMYWRECDVSSRHYYELIREGAPCRLYFDLEFNKRSNPHLTPAVTEDLLTELFDELRRQYDLVYGVSVRRSCVVDLDSSTAKKFSRHWILHLPNGELFSDAREAGLFVRGLVSRLEEEKETGALQSRGRTLLADNLFVNAEDFKDNEEGKKLTRFIDLGVYTRNRIFRLLGSTKFGKPADAALRIADANEFPFPYGFDNTKFYPPSMNRNLPVKSESNEQDKEEEQKDDKSHDTSENETVRPGDFDSFCRSMSWEDHSAALAATLVVPANATKIRYPTLPNPSNLLSDNEKQKIFGLRHVNASGCGTSSKFLRSTPSYGSSPLPKLEKFIVNTLGMRKGITGSIGTWSLSNHRPLPQTMSFNMKDNRFCDNIGREHKSNNIIWNVHLVDRICWQSCHDPDCRGFRGEPIRLPEEVDSEIDEFFLDFELASLDENEIIDGEGNSEAPDGDFDDPVLDAAMRQLDISRVVEENLDVELAKLSLSDIVPKPFDCNEILSDKENQVDALNHVQSDGCMGRNANLLVVEKTGAHLDKEREHATEPQGPTAPVRSCSSEDWDNDEGLDLELSKLNIADIVRDREKDTSR